MGGTNSSFQVNHLSPLRRLPSVSFGKPFGQKGACDTEKYEHDQYYAYRAGYDIPIGLPRASCIVWVNRVSAIGPRIIPSTMEAG